MSSSSDKGTERVSIMPKQIWKICGLLLAFLIVFGVPAANSAKAANETQVGVSINYLEEIATVTAGTGGSTKFYMSTDNKKSWEVLDSPAVVDLSGILQTKSVTVWFKGNKDTLPRPETLQAQADNLKVAYNVTGGVGNLTYSSTNGSSVQYRKGNFGEWKTLSGGMTTDLYEIKGATLQFRTAPSVNVRAGKVYTVKIQKRPSAPSAKVDGSKLAIAGLKEKVTQYRIGDNYVWNTFLPSSSKVTTLDLASLLGVTPNTPIPAATFEFRNLGSDKKLNSAVKIIEVAAQRTVPNTISIVGTSVTITDTDKENSYEYTIVPKNTTLDLTTAKWKGLSTKSVTVIPKVSIGDKVLVRLKAKTDSSTKQIILASTYREFTIDSITVKK